MVAAQWLLGKLTEVSALGWLGAAGVCSYEALRRRRMGCATESSCMTITNARVDQSPSDPACYAVHG